MVLGILYVKSVGQSKCSLKLVRSPGVVLSYRCHFAGTHFCAHFAGRLFLPGVAPFEYFWFGDLNGFVSSIRTSDV